MAASQGKKRRKEKKTRSQNTNNIFLRCVHACITIEERESIPTITILRDHYCC